MVSKWLWKPERFPPSSTPPPLLTLTNWLTKGSWRKWFDEGNLLRWYLLSFVFKDTEENCFHEDAAHRYKQRRSDHHPLQRLLDFIPFQRVKYPITTKGGKKTQSHFLRFKLFQHWLMKIFGVVHCSALCSINIYLNGAVSSNEEWRKNNGLILTN